MNEITIYKIRSRVTGLYSTGGGTPGWSKKGKTWNQRGHVSNHLHGLYPAGKRTYIEHAAEVVTCIIREEDVETTAVSDWLAGVEQRKAEKEAKAKKAFDDRQKAKRFAEYQKLQREFG